MYRSGTRIFENITEIDLFSREPWSSPYVQGIIDAPFLNLTPGTRTGVIYDEALHTLAQALQTLETELNDIIDQQRRAEEEKASVRILRSVQKALKEALLALPVEEYDWFNIHQPGPRRPDDRQTLQSEEKSGDVLRMDTAEAGQQEHKQFFEFAGPLFSVRISPRSCVLPVRTTRNLRALARDRKQTPVDDVCFNWELIEGDGTLDSTDTEIGTFTAGNEPGLVKIRVTALQADVACSAEAIITVTDTLLPESKKDISSRQGLPGYTFKKAPGELWRSRYSEDQNVIVINNGHRDFVFASKTKALKIRYISRLFAKELVCKNFQGIAPDELLERMIELTLYMEENL